MTLLQPVQRPGQHGQREVQPAWRDPNYWDDGATGGYDGIYQTVATTIGDTYSIGFYLNEISLTGFEPAAFQQTCTNGNSGTHCNGADVSVFAGGSIP